MVSGRYIPERGDVVWIDFRPRRGHEQANRRPAVVLSRNPYNSRSGLVLLCPITSRAKGYPFEVEMRDSSLAGVALVDQISTFDWHARELRFIKRLSASVLRNIQKKAIVLIAG